MCRRPRLHRSQSRIKLAIGGQTFCCLVIVGGCHGGVDVEQGVNHWWAFSVGDFKYEWIFLIGTSKIQDGTIDEEYLYKRLNTA